MRGVPESATIADIVAYLKAQPLERLMRGMADTYARRGRVFGAVNLMRPAQDEEAAISEFFGRDYTGMARLRITLTDFERQLQAIAPVSLVDVLREYFGSLPEITARPTMAAPSGSSALADVIIAQVMPHYAGTAAAPWLSQAAGHPRTGYRMWSRSVLKDPAAVVADFRTVADIINSLPPGGLPLAVKPPISSSAAALLVKALSYIYEMPAPTDDETTHSLMARAGILSAGMQSAVIIYGGTIQKGKKSTFAATAYTYEAIAHLDKLHAAGGRVYVFEHLPVYEAVVEALRRESITATVVGPLGASGADSPALQHALRLYTAGGAQIIYAGRMDYKGLTTADRLYASFRRSFTPWRYTKEDFDMATKAGGNTPLLADAKRSMALVNEDLANLLSHMRRMGKTTDGMPLVPLFVQDIKANI